MSRIKLLLLVSVLVVACRSGDSSATLAEPALRAQVDSAFHAYLDAVTQRDSEKIVSFYLNSADFQVLANGQSLDYATWSEGQRAFYSTVREVRGGWTDVRTTLLGPTAALMSGRRDQATVDSSGQIVRRVGAATWIWVKQQNAWRIMHINTFFTEEPSN